MNVALDFVALSEDELEALLNGGTLTVYSVARPASADQPVERSSPLVAFTFATPAFADDSEGAAPRFVANPVPATSVGTPGFAGARKADGKVVADFSAGPGDREIKFSEASFSQGAPVKIVAFKFAPRTIWPERPEYFDTRPRPGFPMPRTWLVDIDPLPPSARRPKGQRVAKRRSCVDEPRSACCRTPRHGLRVRTLRVRGHALLHTLVQTDRLVARLQGEDAARFQSDHATIVAQFPNWTADQTLARLWDQGGYSWLATEEG